MLEVIIRIHIKYLLLFDSLCNNKEIDAVMDYVKDLMYFGLNGEKVSQTDIGIISPYKNQYQRIQEQLDMRNWSQIDCGSVELFQGKEKQVIIVSFVRSFTPKLGFLNNERVSVHMKNKGGKTGKTKSKIH